MIYLESIHLHCGLENGTIRLLSVVDPLGVELSCISRHRDVVMIPEERKTKLHQLTALDVRRNLCGGTPNLVC